MLVVELLTKFPFGCEAVTMNVEREMLDFTCDFCWFMLFFHFLLVCNDNRVELLILTIIVNNSQDIDTTHQGLWKLSKRC